MNIPKPAHKTNARFKAIQDRIEGLQNLMASQNKAPIVTPAPSQTAQMKFKLPGKK